jgi:hypothetical protein
MIHNRLSKACGDLRRFLTDSRGFLLVAKVEFIASSTMHRKLKSPEKHDRL